MFLSVRNYIKAHLKREVILIIFLWVLTGNAFPQICNFRNFNTEDGMAQSYIYSIEQDIRGYLWVGTGNGLSRYNGFVFDNYTTSDSLGDNFINCGIRDGKSMWFGHMNGLLSYFDGRKFHTVTVSHPGLSPVTHLAKSPDNQVWAGTYSDGLLKLNKDSAAVKHYRFKDQTVIISFEFLDNNALLVGTNAGLLYCRLKDPEGIEIIRPVSEIPESKIMCIQKMRNGSGFYIATENDGIFQLLNENNQFKTSKITTDPFSGFTGVQYIYEDSRSDLWLATFGKGLIRITNPASGEKMKINYFNKANGFITDNVKTVYEDREGNIWSGNYGKGLTQITPETFFVYTFDKQEYGNNIFSLCFNGGYRWIGTDNGLVKTDTLTGKVIHFYGKGSGLPKDTVTTVYSLNGKELWIGTEKNGVFRMETGTGKILKYPIGNGALENSVNIITGREDQVWIGTKRGLCSVNTRSNKITWYTISQGGLPHNFINCLLIDRSGRLWVSTSSNVLSYIQGDKVFKVPLNISGILTLGPVTEDSDSRIWVGSNGNGVFMLESDSIANITVKEGLLSNYCYSLICDDRNNIWVGHKGGLSRIRISDLSVKPVQHIKGISDSYQFNPNAIIKDQQDKIWFGSDKGLVLYNPSLEDPRSLPPVLGITSIRINDDIIDFTDRIILAPGNYKIRIDFLGISLKEPELVTYQYKMDGYDQLSEVTKSTSITYPRLTEGNYTFILKASSGDGVVSEKPLTLNIIIKAPLWEKWWFYPVTFLLLMLLAFIYIKRREYRFLAEKRILEEKVAERTSEIQSQKNEIELQRDVINEKNANITSSIQYASHIQNAVLPPIGLIDNLLTDYFILSKPKDIVSGDFYWLTEKENKIVVTVADCTGHGVPGAFMTMLGITFLNEIVNIEGITRSVDIVTNLRERIINSLHQDRKVAPITDGMDMALCVLDKQQKSIQYTGAMNDLIYFHNGNLQVFKADSSSVCAFYNKTSAFTMKEFEYEKGDVFYLFSDGYQDQFGGERLKKFLIPHFRLTLQEIHKLPMPEQKEILERKLSEWMKGEIQTDDITVMGIRL